MFSECIHSLADTINQLILAYGIHKSIQVTIVSTIKYMFPIYYLIHSIISKNNTFMLNLYDEVKVIFEFNILCKSLKRFS